MQPGWRRFNGATTFQPWKLDASTVSDAPPWSLQWGHDFSAVEIAAKAPALNATENASMGPRLFSRGNTVLPQSLLRSASSGFNGATTFQPWKWRPFFALYWHRKMGRFREVGQICCHPLLCANVFTGVFAIRRRFERLPALPEPHNLSKEKVINYLAFG